MSNIQLNTFFSNISNLLVGHAENPRVFMVQARCISPRFDGTSPGRLHMFMCKCTTYM